ncbi:MAG: tRNA (N6-threonylcarbamoyladenosine(37)-N6)-methyltransferase TrmO [Clostridia bacterium]|nr:tRNA (N6-threonylcarbamoyladenosine(37)-N6)-methyltransferase TrmO [Clostridia bacterium]
MTQIIKPIAYISNDFKEKFGIPRQSGRISNIKSKIIFTNEFRNDDALRGIEEFSHLWLIFDFSKSHKEKWAPTVRPPRLGGNKRVGVFASRSPFRPNSLGLSCVKLIKIVKNDIDGSILIVSGADLLDGTPIYDIKPYIPYSDCIPYACGSYAEENKNHRLSVSISSEISKSIPNEKIYAITECIADDPRPSYQNDENKIYSMRYGEYDVHFTVSNNAATIISIDVIT